MEKDDYTYLRSGFKPSEIFETRKFLGVMFSSMQDEVMIHGSPIFKRAVKTVFEI